jgi:hypothetical protein
MPTEELFAALRAAGMPEVPREFSVAPWHQEIPAAALDAVDALIRVFERVTARASWRAEVCASAPEIARPVRPEVCFFSAWDFHLPPDRPERPQLIEFNDNGSGLLFAAIINRVFFDVARPDRSGGPEAPLPVAALWQRVAGMVEREAEEYFGQRPDGLVRG